MLYSTGMDFINFYYFQESCFFIWNQINYFDLFFLDLFELVEICYSVCLPVSTRLMSTGIENFIIYFKYIYWLLGDFLPKLIDWFVW